MATTEVEPILYDAATTAKMLGIGRSKLWEMFTSGEIETVRIGTRRLVHRDTIERYVAELVAKGAS